MHARSGAWHCCDGKGRVARVQCELLLAATFIVLCWTLNLHLCVLLASNEKITCRDHWITAVNANERVLFFAMPLLAHKDFALTGGLKTAMCECLWSNTHCQVRMFLKQSNRRLQQLLAVENKTILQQLKPSTLYMMFQLTLIFYPHHTGMRLQMLFTLTGHLKAAKNECLWSSMEKMAEAFICCPKKNIYAQAKIVKSLHDMF